MKFTSNTLRKSHTLGLLLSTSLLLSACGGSSGTSTSTNTNTSSIAPTVGVFTDSPVEGLRYTGPNFSGLTNAKGEFNYLEGDVVSFSLGGMIFGSVTGAQTITPFSLFNLTAPASAAAIRSELSKEDSDFRKVLNIVTLLVTLDRDNNPDNGLDVSSYDLELANATQSLDLDPIEFQTYVRNDLLDSVGSAASGLNNSFENPLLHFYESLGISVSANLLRIASVDLGNTGSSTNIIENIFNAAGQLTQARTDDGRNVNITQYEYDNNGNETVATNTYVFDNILSSFEQEVDNRTYIIGGINNNKLSTRTEGQTVGPDLSTNSFSYTYDGTTGDLTREFRRFDIRSSVEVIFTYENGQLATSTQNFDDDADRVVDRSSLSTYTYENANEVKRVVRTDTDVTTVDTFNSLSTTINTYTNNQLIKSELSNDSTGNGVVDFVQTTVNTYGSNGRQLTSVQIAVNAAGNMTFSGSISNNNNGDLIKDERSFFNGNESNTLTSYNIEINTYDTNGRVTRNERSSDNDNNPATPFDRSTVNDFQYDAQGREISNRTQINDNGANISDRLTSTTYAANGRTATITFQTGVGAVYSSEVVTTSTYNTAGVQTSYTHTESVTGEDVLRNTYTHTLDPNGGDFITSTTERLFVGSNETATTTNIARYEYTSIEDGLAYLLTRGLDRNPECVINDANMNNTIKNGNVCITGRGVIPSSLGSL